MSRTMDQANELTTRSLGRAAPRYVTRARKPMYRRQLPMVDRSGVSTQPRRAMRVEMFADFKARWWTSSDEETTDR